MQFGSLEVQIFVSLALVLGTVFVAFLVDFLKGNNEVLREKNIELVVRREERIKRDDEVSRILDRLPRQAAKPEPVVAKPPLAPTVATGVVQPESSPAPPVIDEPAPQQWATDEELEGVESLAARISDDALDSLLPQESEARPEEPAVRAEEPRPAEPETREEEALRPPLHAKVTPIDVVAVGQIGAPEEAAGLTREIEHIAGIDSEPPKTGESQTAPEPIPVEVAPEPEDRAEPAPEPVPQFTETEEEVAESAVQIPTGFQDYSLLAEAIARKSLFQGMVLSIAASTASGQLSGDTLQVVIEVIESLLTPDDFGCQSSEDEFLLIFPNVLGADAARRLQYVSRRLWDFQIRTVGEQTVMFSWGSTESNGEPLEEAIAGARDRMLETRRNRERATIEIHSYRQRAANQ